MCEAMLIIILLSDFFFCPTLVEKGASEFVYVTVKHTTSNNK